MAEMASLVKARAISAAELALFEPPCQLSLTSRQCQGGDSSLDLQHEILLYLDCTHSKHCSLMKVLACTGE